MKTKYCTWTYDENHDYYETECKHAFCIIEGTPKDNDMKFCPYCGKEIKPKMSTAKERYYKSGFSDQIIVTDYVTGLEQQIEELKKAINFYYKFRKDSRNDGIILEEFKKVCPTK